MSGFSLPAYAEHRGPVLIGIGLTVILAAQIWPLVPIAAALALIGWGATLSLLENLNVYRREYLAVLNLVVYVLLVGLAIGAQTHAAQASATAKLNPLLWTDHVLATILLASLVGFVLLQFLQADRGT